MKWFPLKTYRLILAGIFAACAVSTVVAAPTPVSYIGSAWGSWSIATNWSPAGVPANSSSSTYSVTISTNPVTFDRTGTTTIDDLAISNSLNLNASCSLSVADQLSLVGASLTSYGGNFTASGTASATTLSVNVTGGAQVAFPLLTQINEVAWPENTLQASGSGSLLNLSSVTTISDSNGLSIQTGTGGKVSLPNLTNIASAAGQSVTLNASGGTIDVSSLVLSGNTTTLNYVQVSNAGTVLWGSPASLSNLGLTISGSGNALNVSQVASATTLSVNVTGGTQVAFPLLTQINEVAWPENTLQASGSGSLLNLSSVTTISDSNGLSIQTGTGGKVSLPNLTNIASAAGQSVTLNASGGTIDVSSLVLSGNTTTLNYVQVSNAGTVLWGSPASLSNLGLTISGSGNALNVSQVASATTLSVNVTGGTQVAFPLLTQINEVAWPESTLQASGSGSLLNLSSVTTISDSNGLSIQTGTGGKVNLPNLTNIASAAGQSVTLNASGGTIDVSSLVLSGNTTTLNYVQVSNAGTVLWGSPASLSNLGLTISGSGNALNVSQVASATTLSVNVTGGTQVAFPLLTQINEVAWPENTLQASGSGSLLNLSSVTTISDSNGLSIQTGTGGKVSLPNLTNIASAAGQSVTLNALGGTIDVSSLVLSGNTTTLNYVQVSNAGTVLWGNPASLSNLGLTISGSGNALNVSQVASATTLSVNVTGGAQVAFPLLTQINEVAWPENTLQASGSGSLLNLSSVTTISDSNGLSIQTGTGGKVSLPNLTNIASAASQSVTLNASGGTIDVSSLVLSGNTTTLNYVQVSNAGTVLWGSPASLSNLGLTISGSSNATQRQPGGQRHDPQRQRHRRGPSRFSAPDADQRGGLA